MKNKMAVLVVTESGEIRWVENRVVGKLHVSQSINEVLSKAMK